MNQNNESATADETILFEGHPAVVPSITALLLAVVTLGIWLLPMWWRSRGLNYRFTSKRIVVETGLLNKKLEQIDLYRINDYTVTRPLSQRLLGTGNITLRTMDKSTPEVLLRDLPTDVVALYEKLRKATELDKAHRGVRVVDYE